MSSDQTHAAPPDSASVDLAQFDDDFTESEVQEQSFDPIPDGKYQVNVHKVEIVHAQTSGAPMLKWTLRVLGPQCQGRLLWRNSVISRNSLRYLKTDLHRCGLDLAKLSDLPAHLSKLLDVKLEVAVRTKEESQTIFFNRRLESVDPGPDFPARADDALAPF
jgi:hypothetical protein